MTRYIEADLRTIPNAFGIAPRTVVGIPPSDADAYTDRMRVAIGSGRIILRAFDPGAPVATGAPIGFVTELGESLLAEDGDPLTTEVIS